MLPVNLSLNRRFLFVLLLTTVARARSPHLSFALQTAAADICKPTITGEVQIFELASKIFENTRAARVLLPPGYSAPENKDRKYPVLYMLDGQNLFDACTAFDHVHEWEIDEPITRLVKEGKIEPLVVVGLDNAREKRAYEYLAWKDNLQNPAMAEPAGNRLPEFFLKEVMPLIEQNTGLRKVRRTPPSAAPVMAASRHFMSSSTRRSSSARFSPKARYSGSETDRSSVTPLACR